MFSGQKTGVSGVFECLRFSIYKNFLWKVMGDQEVFKIFSHLAPSFLKASFLLLKKSSFPSRISSVNVTKSAENCGFGHIYWWNPSWKTSTSCKKECTPGNVAWVNLWRNLLFMIRMRRKVVKLPVPAIKKAVNWFAMKCKLFGCRSSQWKRFIKQGVLKTFAKFTEEHLC